MSKHTPGPWMIEGKARNVTPHPIRITGNGHAVAYAFGGKRKDANARLIAAAPELLEKLIDMTNRFEKCLIHSGTDKEYAEIAVSNARAIIARAMGED